MFHILIADFWRSHIPPQWHKAHRLPVFRWSLGRTVLFCHTALIFRLRFACNFRIIFLLVCEAKEIRQIHCYSFTKWKNNTWRLLSAILMVLVLLFNFICVLNVSLFYFFHFKFVSHHDCVTHTVRFIRYSFTFFLASFVWEFLFIYFGEREGMSCTFIWLVMAWLKISI